MYRSQIMLHHAWNPRFFRIALDTGSLSHCEVNSLAEKPSSTESKWSELLDLWQDDVHIEIADKSTIFSGEHTYSWQLVVKGKVLITASARSELDRNDWVDEVNAIITTRSKNGNYSSIFAFQKLMNGTRAQHLKALKDLTEKVNRYIKQIMSKPGAPKEFNSMTRTKVKEFVIENFGSLAYERFKTNIRSLQAAWVDRTVKEAKSSSNRSVLRRRIMERNDAAAATEDNKSDLKLEEKDESGDRDGSVSPMRRERRMDSAVSQFSTQISNSGMEENMLFATQEIISEREENFQLIALRNVCSILSLSFSLVPFDLLFSHSHSNLHPSPFLLQVLLERFSPELVEKYKFEIMFMHATKIQYEVEYVLKPGVIRTLLDTVTNIANSNEKTLDDVNWRSIKSKLLKVHTEKDVSAHKRICQKFLEAFTKNKSYHLSLNSLKKKKKKRFLTRCLNSNVIGFNVKYINVLRIAIMIPFALSILYFFPPLRVEMMPLYIIFVLPIVPFIPSCLGWFLTTILRVTALNGHPFDVGSLEIVPKIKRDHNGKMALHLRLVVEDAGFGNPSHDYPHYYFVECKRCDFEFSIPLATLWNLRRWKETGWSPFPNDVMQNIRVRERQRKLREQQRVDKRKLRDRIHTIVDEKDLLVMKTPRHRRNNSSGSSDGMNRHRRDESWDSISGANSAEEEKTEVHETTHEINKIIKLGSLDIIAAMSDIDDDTKEWRRLSSHRHIHPYNVDMKEFRSFGHTDGNRMTPIGVEGHVVPAVRLDVDLSQHQDIVQECEGWSLVWDNSKRSDASPTCSIWMPDPPRGFAALGVTCLTGDDASKPPSFKVLCVKKSHTTAIDTKGYPTWSDNGSGAGLDIKLCILPHGLLWPVRIGWSYVCLFRICVLFCFHFLSTHFITH